jgi:hypothetical protein
MTAMAISVNSNQSTVATKQKPQSKQLRYYYRHKAERLAYQRDYYQKNKDSILYHRALRHYTKEVKRTEQYICFIPEIRKLAYNQLKIEKDKSMLKDAYFHCHGAPKHRVYSKPKRTFYFHMPTKINIWITANGKPYPTLSTVKPTLEALTGKQLSLKICHALGFEWGTSMAWHEVNEYTNKLETHILCFDGSGLDQSHKNDVVRLQAYACESGLRGKELMAKFADTYSAFCYLRMWKGNKVLYSQF